MSGNYDIALFDDGKRIHTEVDLDADQALDTIQIWMSTNHVGARAVLEAVKPEKGTIIKLTGTMELAVKFTSDKGPPYEVPTGKVEDDPDEDTKSYSLTAWYSDNYAPYLSHSPVSRRRFDEQLARTTGMSEDEIKAVHLLMKTTTVRLDFNLRGVLRLTMRAAIVDL